MTSKPILCAVVVAGLSAASQPAAAAVYDLRAAATTMTMPDGTQVTMWGFGLTTDPAVSVPGPALVVPPGDDTLTINLTNALPVPVSIVIPAIPTPLTPVWSDGSSGPRTNLTQRAVSFTHVAQPGQTVSYQWTNIQPGTYLYHSGTHPAVQVPMGLYGAVTHDAVAGQAYGTAYDRDLVLVYSEIDPALNAAVAGGTYGTASYPTTINYQPRYFLINGQPATTPPELEQGASERLLLRVINAGLGTIVPTLASGSMRLLAEDGHAAPFARASYSMLLPAGKTRDALIAFTAPGTTALFDRRGSAQLARITALPGPAAVADVYAATEDTTLDTTTAGLPSVLANDTGAGLTAVLDTTTTSGTLVLASDGSFTYTPNANFNGVDSFTYHPVEASIPGPTVTVTITVAPVNDAPVAVADAYQAIAGVALSVPAPGVLANDSDVDGDPLTAQLVQGPSGGTLVAAADGSLQYTANAGTTADDFTYQATDGTAPSNIVAVSITVAAAANAPPIARFDFAITWRNTAAIIDVVANDSDSDGAIDPASLVVASPPVRGGVATSVGDGTIRFLPRTNFAGIDVFTYRVRDDRGAAAVTRVFVWVLP